MRERVKRQNFICVEEAGEGTTKRQRLVFIHICMKRWPEWDVLPHKVISPV